MATPINSTSGILQALERNNFFYGKLMDVQRFEMEQQYFNEKLALINRFVLGSGVVCGLEVVADTDDTGVGRILPGMAIDGLGRMIIVSKPVAFDPHQLTDDQGNPTGDPIEFGTVSICLAYAEKATDPVPVLVPDCDTPGNCAPSTIHEGFCIIVRLTEDGVPEPPGCTLGEFPLPPAKTLHKLLGLRINKPCPELEGGPCVLLARVQVEQSDDVIFDSLGGRSLVYANPLLYELILCLAERIQLLAQGRVLRYVSGDGQSGPGGEQLADPLVVSLVDAGGNAVDGEIVRFDVTAGDGSVGSQTTSTDTDGTAKTDWTLGPEGDQKVIASAVGTGFAVTFKATVIAA